MELENGISAGISLRLLRKGLVPIYEEHSARIERNISLEVWSEMGEMEKALIIAQRRIAIAMKNLQSDAEAEQIKREANKNRKH